MIGHDRLAAFRYGLRPPLHAARKIHDHKPVTFYSALTVTFYIDLNTPNPTGAERPLHPNIAGDE